MTLARQIAHNTLWQILGKAIGVAAGVVMIALLTRYLGQTNFGYYTTALAFMQFFGVLVDMGLYLIALKEISAKPEKENSILSNIFTLRFFSALIFLGGASALIFVFPYPSVVKWSAALVSLGFFFMALTQILTAPCQKYLKMGEAALAEAAGRIVLLGAMVLLIVYRQNLPAMMLSNVSATLVNFLILWWVVKKTVKITWAFDFHYWQEVCIKAWPIALGIAFNLVYFRADTIILAVFRPAAEVGLYGAPYKMLEIIATFPHMFMGLVMPILTASWLEQNLERFKNVMQKTFDFFVMLAVPMVLGSLPLADKIMKLVAGQQFIASGPLLPILMLATGFIFLGTLFTYTLVVLDKQKPMLKYFFLAAVLSLIGYFIFIPRYSYFGAAWVTVAIEGLIALSAFYLTFQLTKTKLSLNVFIKSLISGLVMMFALYSMSNLPILIALLLAVMIYGIIMILIKGIDYQLLKNMVRLK